jgi:hypothetical protein
VQGQRQAAGAQWHEIYLRQPPLAYRLTLVVPLQYEGRGDTFPARQTAGEAATTALLNTFAPAADPAAQPLGYAPVLGLRGGQLWAADADGGRARPLKIAGQVQTWSVSPDLSQVAVIRDDGALAVVRADGTGAEQVLATVNNVRDVAWYGSGQLAVLAEDKTVASGPGLYLVDLQVGGARRLLAVLDSLTAGGRTLSQLQARSMACAPPGPPHRNG